MKKLLIVLLVVFLLVDVYFAINLFAPTFIDSVKNKITNSKVVISTEIPNKRVSLTNASYLNKKLDELNFWSSGRVRHYISGKIERVTVKSVILNISDKPQAWGQRATSNLGDEILYSYGQTFNPKTGAMTVSVHLNPAFQPNLTLSQRYSGIALFALFDLVQPYPVSDQIKYSQNARAFLRDLTSGQRINSFIEIK